ncbi:hypothetical protein BDF14DRAFT_1323891 [Spinellus fusiger]|nr:hypothetical protein BDF14DRAFT_1323891 [Spinellus fusiger]
MNRLLQRSPLLSQFRENRRLFTNSSRLMSSKQLYLVVAHDKTDAQALERRMASRNEHLQSATSHHEKGSVLFAGAFLDSHESGKMIGSALLLWSESKEALEKQIQEDPYTENNVWDKYTIYPMRLALPKVVPN